MNRLGVSVGLLLPLAFAAPAQVQERVTQRECYHVPEGFAPPEALLSALARVMRWDERWFVLAHAPLHETEDQQNEYERRVHALRKEFHRLLPGEDPTDRQLLRMDLFHAGYEAFRKACEEDPDLKPDDLSHLVDPRFLRSPPIVPSRVWNLAQKERRLLERKKPLPRPPVPAVGNVSLRFLLFGALHDERFWKRQEAQDARGKFLAELIRRGAADAPVSGEVVKDAFSPPLVWRDIDPRPGFVTAAVGMPERAGPIGFSEEHAARVRDLTDEAIEEIQRLAARRNQDLGHADEVDRRLRWLTDLSQLIAREIETGTVRRTAALPFEERLDHWRRLARALSFEGFRDRVVDRIEALLDPERWLDDGDLPQDDRIRELIGLALAQGAEDPADVLADGTGLTDDQKEELHRLFEDRREETLRELTEVGRLLLAKGRAQGLTDEADATLLETLPESLRRAGADVTLQERLLRPLWQEHSFSIDSSRARALAERVLLRSDPEVGDATPASFLVNRLLVDFSSGRDQDENRALLEKLATDAPSTWTRTLAMAQAPRVFGDRAKTVYDKTWKDAMAPDSGLTGPERRRLLLSLVDALEKHFEQRPDDGWLPEVASRVFGWDPDRGASADDPFARGLLNPDEKNVLDLWRSLPEAVRARLRAAGRGVRPGGH